MVRKKQQSNLLPSPQEGPEIPRGVKTCRGQRTTADVRNSEQQSWDDQHQTLVNLQQSNEVAPPQFDNNGYSGLLLQPASRPISGKQLANELKSIYDGLQMVEKRCAVVDDRHAKLSTNELKQKPSDHWQALIALHRTLLHEHHDFLLASQHPSAPFRLRQLPQKFDMLPRMYTHGTHNFLEVMRRALPESQEYLLTFIYLVYHTISLLHETVPAFEDHWTEWLGDLGRYRMAVEQDDMTDRQVWADVSRDWYTIASDRNPRIGRLYHHLAILAKKDALQKFYYYGRSLHSQEPYQGARSSVKTLLDHFTERERTTSYMPTPSPLDASFIRAHDCIFLKDKSNTFETFSEQYRLQLDDHIGRVTAKWKEEGVYTAVSNIASWFDYGSNENVLRQLFLLRTTQRTDPGFAVETLEAADAAPKAKDPAKAVSENLQIPKIPEKDIPSKLKELQSESAFSRGTRLTNDTFSIVLRRIGDKNVLPHVYVMLSFLLTFASVEYVTHFIDPSPWTDITKFLNMLIKTGIQENNGIDVNAFICQPVFPSEHDVQRHDELPLPEVWMIRGLIWAEEYLPANWFEREHDKEDRYLELASTVRNRTERVLRLGYQLATVCVICHFLKTGTNVLVQLLDILRRTQFYFYLYNCTVSRSAYKEVFLKLF